MRTTLISQASGEAHPAGSQLSSRVQATSSLPPLTQALVMAFPMSEIHGTPGDVTGLGSTAGVNTRRHLSDRVGRRRQLSGLDLHGTVLDLIAVAGRPGRRHITPGKTGVPGPGAAEGGPGAPR
ncbi:hypothetical protein Sme01_66700 [Sphaerisporangium melleum]|uniref:Uncharacterized protein n=1 Tax=Sphaerisporangium melleum TaxID=321316 RepID=A0A917VR95_9ACTN|nr:hypothetical protein GCM10007964_55930 [Sphaerisporangium melleum]GII74194.1 hypothetical protein Sme01_66700 [Sphaerisporangium melleum]